MYVLLTVLFLRCVLLQSSAIFAQVYRLFDTVQSFMLCLSISLCVMSGLGIVFMYPRRREEVSQTDELLLHKEKKDEFKSNNLASDEQSALVSDIDVFHLRSDDSINSSVALESPVRRVDENAPLLSAPPPSSRTSFSVSAVIDFLTKT